MIFKRKRSAHKGRRQEYSYCPVIWVRDPNGDRRQHWGGSFRTKAAAQAEERKLLQERDRGADLRRSKLTMAEVFQQYINEKRAKVRASTLVRSQELLSLLLPTIGSKQLDQLRPAHISDAYNQLLRRLSKRSVRHCHWQLHGALGLAVDWGQIATNVADRVKPPEPDHFEGRSVTPQELAGLLAASQQTPLAPLVVLAVDSGAREGELLALRWSDISLADGLVHISRSVRRMKEGYVFSEPKTRRGRRTVEISAPTVAVLRAYHQRQLEQRFRLGELWADFDLVFPTETGQPQDGTAISRAFAKIASEAGLQGLRFHDLRHSSVSLLLQSGEPMADVSRRAGHATIGVTVDTYGHRLGTGGSLAATMGTILGQAINDPMRWLANG